MSGRIRGPQGELDERPEPGGNFVADAAVAFEADIVRALGGAGVRQVPVKRAVAARDRGAGFAHRFGEVHHVVKIAFRERSERFRPGGMPVDAVFVQRPNRKRTDRTGVDAGGGRDEPGAAELAQQRLADLAAPGVGVAEEEHAHRAGAGRGRACAGERRPEVAQFGFDAGEFAAALGHGYLLEAKEFDQVVGLAAIEAAAGYGAGFGGRQTRAA